MAVQHEVEKMPFVFQCIAFFFLSLKKTKGGGLPFKLSVRSSGPTGKALD